MNKISTQVKKNGVFGKLSSKTKRDLMKLYAKAIPVMLAIYTASCMCITAFAEDAPAPSGSGDVSGFNGVVKFVVEWVQRIGYVVAFIGGIQFALGFKRDDSEGKTSGLMTLGAGFLVVGICIAYNTLFKGN